MNGSNNQEREEKMLNNQFHTHPTSLKSSMQFETEELKSLRIEVKEQQKELASLKNVKTKNKEL